MCPVLVSLVIPTLDRAGDLRRLLASIQRQSVTALEVIVVDNGSKDETAQVLQQAGIPVRVIWNRRNLGAAHAKNQGIVASRAPLVWFLDSDTELYDPDVVRRALDLMATYPGIGILGGEMTLGPDGRIVYHVKAFRRNGETRDMPETDPVRLRVCDYLPTCNCLARKSLLEAWGGFDPAYFVLSEDDELGHAVRRAGALAVFDASVTVIHHLSTRGRVTSLELANRNRVRCALHNLPAPEVLRLPLREIQELLSWDSVSSLGSTDTQMLLDRYLGGFAADLARSHPRTRPIATAVFGARYLSSLVKAYWYHLGRVPEILRIRRARPNFLAQTRISGSP